MVTVIYEPNGDNKLNDHLAAQFGEFVAYAMNLGVLDLTILISNGLAIHSIRAAVKQGKIPHRSLQFKYKSEDGMKILSPDHNGKLSEWPDGFADQYEKVMEKLL